MKCVFESTAFCAIMVAKHVIVRGYITGNSVLCSSARGPRDIKNQMGAWAELLHDLRFTVFGQNANDTC